MAPRTATTAPDPTPRAVAPTGMRIAHRICFLLPSSPPMAARIPPRSCARRPTMTATTPRTETDREAAIDELLAKLEIRDALMRYSRGIDLLDPRPRQVGLPPRRLRRPRHLQGQRPRVRRARDRGTLAPRVHRALPRQLPHRGRGRPRLLRDLPRRLPSHSRGEDGVASDFTWGGRYVDVFERRDGGPWLILHRTVVHSWSRRDPVLDANADMSANFTQVARAIAATSSTACARSWANQPPLNPLSFRRMSARGAHGTPGGQP